MHSAKHSINTARTQYQQKQDKDFESHHKEVQPHYIEWRATGRDILIHIPGQYNQQKWRHRRSKDTESKFWRSKQIKNLNKTKNIQFNCQGSFTLRIGDMANYTEDTKENTDLHQQMPVQNTTPEVDRQH